MDSTIILSSLGLLGTLLGSILGAWIGGRYAKKSVLIAADKHSEADRNRERQEIANIRKALKTEIDTLFSRYLTTIGKQIEAHETEEPFWYYFPAYQKYYIVFENNAHLVGKIPDDNERKLIVETYSAARGLLDNYLYNNSLIDASLRIRSNDDSILGVKFQHRIYEINEIMRGHAPTLKSSHYAAIRLFELLTISLGKDLS